MTKSTDHTRGRLAALFLALALGLPGAPTHLERAVLRKLFDGPHPALRALLEQAQLARASSRRFTGAGFFTSLSVPAWLPAASLPSSRIRFGDVGASVQGLEGGLGFMVYVDEGKLTMLEGYCYDETWPDRLDGFELQYHDPCRPSVDATFGPIL